MPYRPDLVDCWMFRIASTESNQQLFVLDLAASNCVLALPYKLSKRARSLGSSGGHQGKGLSRLGL